MAPDPETSATLARIRAAIEAASPGDWEAHVSDAGTSYEMHDIWRGDEMEYVAQDCTEADGHFIVTARAAMPSLLAAVEAVLNQHRRRDEPERTHHVCAEHVHQRRHRPDIGLQSWREAVDACPDCTVVEKWVCAERSCRHECPDDDEWPCPTYEAIRAALAGTGKGGEDG